MWDLKTTGNYGYGEKVAGSDNRGVVTAPEGPGDEHVLQTAIYGGSLGADAIGVSYISAPTRSAATSTCCTLRTTNC